MRTLLPVERASLTPTEARAVRDPYPLDIAAA